MYVCVRERRRESVSECVRERERVSARARERVFELHLCVLGTCKLFFLCAGSCGRCTLLCVSQCMHAIWFCQCMRPFSVCKCVDAC
jgi:hypothetical protein